MSMKSQNYLGWKSPPRSSCPTVKPALPRPLLNPVPHATSTCLSNSSRDDDSTYFSQQPIIMPGKSLREEIFSYIQPKPHLGQIEAASYRPVTCSLGAEPNPHLSGSWGAWKGSPKPPQLPQMLLVLQSLSQLCSLLWAHSSPSMSLLEWGAQNWRCIGSAQREGNAAFLLSTCWILVLYPFWCHTLLGIVWRRSTNTANLHTHCTQPLFLWDCSKEYFLCNSLVNGTTTSKPKGHQSFS